MDMQFELDHAGEVWGQWGIRAFVEEVEIMSKGHTYLIARAILLQVLVSVKT